MTKKFHNSLPSRFTHAQLEDGGEKNLEGI